MSESDLEKMDSSPSHMEDFFSEPPNKLKTIVVNGDSEELKALVDNGHTTNTPDKYGRVALHNAIDVKRKECFDILIKAKDVRVNAGDFHGVTPLMYACRNSEGLPGAKYMVRALLKHPDIDPFLADNDLKTALHHAARWGNLTFVKWLVKFGLSVDSPDVLQNTPLLDLLSRKLPDAITIEICLYLIRHGASVWSVDSCNRSVMDACLSRSEVSMAILKTIPEERLKEINFRKDKPPLLWDAAVKGNLPLTEALINLGFDFNPDSENASSPPVINEIISKGGNRKILELAFDFTDKEQLRENGHQSPQGAAIFKLLEEDSKFLPLEDSVLWFLSNRYEEFYVKPYRINCSYFHVRYKSMTLLSEFLMAFPSNDRKIPILQQLVSLPKCVVSENTGPNFTEVLPPLVAAAVTEPLLLGEILDVLLKCNAKVRTRHCFAFFLDDPFWMIMIIKAFISRDIFYLDDLFEDDLSILFEAMGLGGTDRGLELLLSLRLEYGPISPSKLVELHQHLGRKQKRSLKLVENALKDKKVRKLEDLARLSIKKHFDFVEDDCRMYLDQTHVPNKIIDFVIKGNLKKLNPLAWEDLA